MNETQLPAINADKTKQQPQQPQRLQMPQPLRSQPPRPQQQLQGQPKPVVA
jgi:hypothetical protein